MLPRLILVMIVAFTGATAASAQSAKPLAKTTLISGNASENIGPLVGAGFYTSSSEIGYYLNGGVSLLDEGTGASSGTIGYAADAAGTGYFLNIGASMPVGGRITLYGGIGLAGVAKASESTTTSALTLAGGSTSDPAGGDARGTNYNAGVLVSAGNVVFEAGYNTYFETSYVGIGFGF